MRIPYAAVPRLRLAVVAAFTALCAVIFGFLWIKAGGKIPLLVRTGYEVTVPMKNIDNLVYMSDVSVAGVNVGKVQKIEVDGDTDMVTISLDKDVAPLHRGAVVTVRNKTLVEETYLDIRDGGGAELSDGSTLPATSAVPAVKLNDLLTSLKPDTRRNLSALVRSSGSATEDRKGDVDAMLTGLEEIGRNADTLHALAHQSRQLRSLVRASTTVLDSLDTQQGTIVGLVRDAQTITRVTDRHSADVQNLMRTLPPLLDRVRSAGGGLKKLSGPLGTVATNLRAAAPNLNAALLQLPATTRDLRGLVPSLDTTLRRSPATLRLLPPFQKAASPWLGTLVVNMADLNPMLAYLSPYGPDVAAYFRNFEEFAGSSDGNGRIARVKPIFSSNSVDLPARLSTATGFNPYPAPGTDLHPQGFQGAYPQIHQDPVP